MRWHVTPLAMPGLKLSRLKVARAPFSTKSDTELLCGVLRKTYSEGAVDRDAKFCTTLSME
jgi:hypothetical protein